MVLNVYKNLSENEKQKLAAHRKIIIEWAIILIYNYKEVF